MAKGPPGSTPAAPSVWKTLLLGPPVFVAGLGGLAADRLPGAAVGLAAAARTAGRALAAATLGAVTGPGLARVCDLLPRLLGPGCGRGLDGGLGGRGADARLGRRRGQRLFHAHARAATEQLTELRQVAGDAVLLAGQLVHLTLSRCTVPLGLGLGVGQELVGLALGLGHDLVGVLLRVAHQGPGVLVGLAPG